MVRDEKFLEKIFCFPIESNFFFSKRKDIDKNGRVDSKEMEQIVTVRRSKKRSSKKTSFSFFKAIYDLLGEENRKGENSPTKRVEKIMNKLDLNGDRSLTKDEFINGCLQDDFLRSLLAPNA